MEAILSCSCKFSCFKRRGATAACVTPRTRSMYFARIHFSRCARFDVAVGFALRQPGGSAFTALAFSHTALPRSLPTAHMKRCTDVVHTSSVSDRTLDTCEIRHGAREREQCLGWARVGENGGVRYVHQRAAAVAVATARHRRRGSICHAPVRRASDVRPSIAGTPSAPD